MVSFQSAATYGLIGAITLQMALLSGQKEEKIANEGHAWAISKIALLERELKAAKAENCTLRVQVNQFKG